MTRKKKGLSALTKRQKERARIMRNLLKRAAIRKDVERVGGVGLPSKMPGTAYGLSAHKCGVGGKLAEREGSVCYDCYAMKNNYTYPSVTEAHEKRHASLHNWEEWIEAWCNIMQFLSLHLPEEEWYHRWHDSGDVMSTKHLGAIAEVARRNDKWDFWLPSKEYGAVGRHADTWGIPSNLTVRMSMPYLCEAPTGPIQQITGLTSTVGYNEGRQCPAPEQEGFCDTCRACWAQSVTNVNYKQH